MTRKILVLGNTLINNSLTKYGTIEHSALRLEDCDLVVFSGEQPEDGVDWRHVFALAFNFELPMLGIGNGAQFLCDMHGGYLVDNVTNHEKNHYVYTYDKQYFKVNSLHTKMMVPESTSILKGESRVLAWSEGLSDRYEDEHGNDIRNDLPFDYLSGGLYKEPEIVYWEITRSLAFQYHPELMSVHSEGHKYYQQLIENNLL